MTVTRDGVLRGSAPRCNRLGRAPWSVASFGRRPTGPAGATLRGRRRWRRGRGGGGGKNAPKLQARLAAPMCLGSAEPLWVGAAK